MTTIPPSKRVAGLFVALAAAAAAPGQPQGRPPTAVIVEPLRREAVQENRRVTGELRAERRSDVAAREPGLVVELPVVEGRRVARGDVLARLDSRRLKLAHEESAADLEAAEAALAERRATLAWREEELALYRRSAERGAANVKELLDAEAAVRIAAALARRAEHQVNVIKARLALLEKRIADMTISAPFDGAVVTLQRELGEWVGEGEAVAELVSSGIVEAWLEVPQRFYAAVTDRSAGIELELEATGERLSSNRLRVIPQIDPTARSFAVVVTLDDAGGRRAPGMSLKAWVPTGVTSERLLVHKDAVLRNEAGAYVFAARAREDGPAQAVPVKVEVLFPVNGRLAVVSEGLRPDDRVVVEGNERLFPMTPVTAVERGADAGDAAAGAPR